MAKSSSRPLQDYQNERDSLLKQVITHLRSDSRILAAFLAGSLGRGESDELSDLDLWAVVKEEYIARVVTERRQYASLAGDVILFVEAPQNAPAGGGYLAACYDASTAPHLVDWYWQPETLALPAVPVKLLFDRSGPAGAPAPAHIASQTAPYVLPGQEIHSISFFWMMLLITAKHVARQSPKVNELLKITLASFRQTVDFLNSICSKDEFSAFEIDETRAARGQLAFLHRLAAEMQAMMARASELGYRVPERMVPGAFRYLEMVNTISGETTE